MTLLYRPNFVFNYNVLSVLSCSVCVQVVVEVPSGPPKTPLSAIMSNAC